MRRREFIAGLSGAAAWPLAARAQQAAVPVIGFLGSTSYDAVSRYYTAPFLLALRQSGYVDGQNVTIEFRWAEGQPDRLPALARDLANRATVIATYDTAASIVAKAATTTIPIIFATGGDPIKLGLVASLARPGDNATGVTFLINALGSKRLELLRQLVPTAANFAFLFDPSNPNAPFEGADIQAAANQLGLKLVVAGASTTNEIDAAFATFVARRVEGLAIAAHAYLGQQSKQLAELALRNHLPAIYGFRVSVEAGGLMSYGGSLTESVHQQGIYTARVLRGEKDADLPVQQVTRFELILNLKAAKALGLTVPNALLVSADEVIE